MANELEVINQTLEVNIDKELEAVSVQIQPAIVKHRSRVKNALTFGAALLEELRTNGGEMTPELDAKFKEYLQKIKVLAASLKDDRAIITKSMDLVREQFTSVENLLDPKKPTIIAEIERIRNDYAAALALAEKNRLAEIARQQARKEEIIRVKAEIEKQFMTYFNGHLSDKKMKLSSFFNGMTLASFNLQAEQLKNFNFVYDMNHFSAFKFNGISRLDQDDFSAAFTEVITPLYDIVSATYTTQLTELRATLVDQLKSKENELIQIAEFEKEQEAARIEAERLAEEAKKATEARRADIARIQREEEEKRQARLAELNRMEAERIERERQEAQRIEAERLESERKAAQEAQTKAETEKVMTLFETEIATAETPEIPKIKEGWEIKVENPAGYMELFLNWFNKAGSKLSLEDLDKKLDFTRKFAEKEAIKDETKMLKSNFLKYQPTYKADNRKSK